MELLDPLYIYKKHYLMIEEITLAKQQIVKVQFSQVQHMFLYQVTTKTKCASLYEYLHMRCDFCSGIQQYEGVLECNMSINISEEVNFNNLVQAMKYE